MPYLRSVNTFKRQMKFYAGSLSSSNKVNTEIRNYYLSFPVIVVCSKKCNNSLNNTATQHKITEGTTATRHEVAKIWEVKWTGYSAIKNTT